MSVKLENMVINFNSEWFQSGYYVYVLTIVHIAKGTYYYVGQTGDRNHTSARSPFYRLMGHFNTYNLRSGTDAQLVSGLIKNDLIEKPSENKKARKCVEEAIVNKTIIITANYFSISDFNSIEHSSKRKTVEEIELSLINNFRLAKLNLFNDLNKIGDNKTSTNLEAIRKAKNIFESINSIMNFKK
ncbi:MAG: hypothetical protein PHT69_14560 [Bacteroidales bacterium]|nr:hypothetical protein [Bacteroidales bacterium]